jgi:phage tail protein X
MAQTYTTVQGDMFDYIAIKFYGDDHLGDRIMEANPDYTTVRIFSGGITLTMPDIAVKRVIQLIDWKEAQVLP